MHARRSPLSSARWATCALALAAPAAGALQDCAASFAGGDLAGDSAVGGLSPSLSADGRRVAYLQFTSLYHAFLHDVGTGARLQIDAFEDGTPMGGAAGALSLSADGLSAAFMSSAGSGLQVYVKDLADGELHLASAALDGEPMTPTGVSPGMGPTSISAHGERVVFASNSAELSAGKTTWWTDVFVRDLASGTTLRVLGQGGAEPDLPALDSPAISADGRFVAFASRARNMVGGDTNGFIDVFVHDLASGATERVSAGWAGDQANHDSGDPAISADGRFVAFPSRASNLVPGDTNGARDVFVHDRATGQTQRANLGPGGVQADAGSDRTPRLSAGGQHVLFHSTATNLLDAPASGGHLYVRHLESQTTVAVVDDLAGPSANDVAGLSADGLAVAYAGLAPFGPADANGFFDVFLKTCAPAAPASFCPATQASSGCVPTIQWKGQPSATAGSGFALFTEHSASQRPGLLVYSTFGAALIPFSGSFLCLSPPLQRTHVLASGGHASDPCSGSFALDFNQWIAAGSDASLVEGAAVWAQFWSRDGGAPGLGHLSNGVSFAIGR